MKLDKFLKYSTLLQNTITGTHTFYIGDDILSQDVFFPSKRFPLVVFLKSNHSIEKIIEALKACYGDKKEVVVIANDECKEALSSLSLVHFPCVLLFEGEAITSSERFDFSDLVQIMSKLLGENGCEWDKAQTHQSIRINLIEEAYELVDAIDSGDTEAILEEAGDVLLQAVFHTHLEMIEGGFDYSDMLSALCKKLLFRHTHIFGCDSADDEKMALDFWNRAKTVEKGFSNCSEELKALPSNLPALLYAFKLQKKAAKVGFDWDKTEQVILKMKEELGELLEASDDEKTMEGGDLLFATVNLLRFLDIEPELALRESSRKFIDRFSKMEKALLDKGKKLEDCSLAQMDSVWNKVKSKEKSK